MQDFVGAHRRAPPLGNSNRNRRQGTGARLCAPTKIWKRAGAARSLLSRLRSYQTTGIVLKQKPLGEADRIVTLYTADRGKVRAVAGGIRKARSRLAGHLEPLTLVQVSLAHGRELDHVTEAATLDSFRALREDLSKLSVGMYLAEIVESFAQEHAANSAEFDLLIGALSLLQTVNDPAILLRHFEVRVLGAGGFGPELQRCVECHAVLEPGDHTFSCAMGGLLCADCKGQTDGVSMRLSLNAIKVLRNFQRAPYDAVAGLKLSPPLLAEVSRLLSTYIRSVLDHELKSAEFMHMVGKG